jgi:TatD DNase family protein
MLFDSHCHLNFSAYDDDREQVIERCLKNGAYTVNVGSNEKTSKSAALLASKYRMGVYASIGLHPIHTWKQMVDEEESHFTSKEEDFDEKTYEGMLGQKVVAVGECGLDYYHLDADNILEAKDKQKMVFIKQIRFAKKHSLPMILHCRDAYEDLLEVLDSESYHGDGAVHSFTGGYEIAKKFLDRGLYLGFNAILTFDKTGRLAEVVEKAPAEKLLSETDAPYLAPQPFRGKRNEPLHVRYVVEKMAQIKKAPYDEFASKLFKNACSFYKIKSQ